MARGALDDSAGVPLQFFRRDVVIVRVDRIRPDRVRAVVTALAGDAAVARAEAEQLAGVLGEPLVAGKSRRGSLVVRVECDDGPQAIGCHQRRVELKVAHGVARVAGLAARQVGPRTPRLAVVGAVDAAALQQGRHSAYRGHVAVAVLAVHRFRSSRRAGTSCSCQGGRCSRTASA